MFDLQELEAADRALTALAGGRRKAAAPGAVTPKPSGDIARCPFHNPVREIAA
jgi:hypothetical protein